MLSQKIECLLFKSSRANFHILDSSHIDHSSLQNFRLKIIISNGLDICLHLLIVFIVEITVCHFKTTMEVFKDIDLDEGTIGCKCLVYRNCIENKVSTRFHISNINSSTSGCRKDFIEFSVFNSEV